MNKTAAWLFLILFLLARPSSVTSAATVYSGTSFSLRHHGQVRNVMLSGRSLDLFGPGTRYLYDIQRFRSDWLATLWQHLNLRAVYDHDIQSGDYLESAEFAFSRTVQPPEVMDLESTVLERDRLLWRQRLYRLYAQLDWYPLRITVGRQQVAWGTGYFWNPTDLFNPVTFTSAEPDERFGADAANLELALGTLNQVQAVIAPARGTHRSRGALKFKTNVLDYDFSMVGGWYFRDRLAGADFSGQIGGTGFRGEWVHAFAWSRSDYDQLVLGLDRMFPGHLTLTGEYLYNSGALDLTHALEGLDRAQGGSVFSFSRHLAGLYADWQAHPLLHLSSYGSVDLVKGSLFLGPRAVWNARTDLDLTLGAMFTGGKGEYELYSNSYFLMADWHF